MSTSVKVFHSEMADAPALNGVAGSMHDVLRNCLVTGFSLRTVNSVTIEGGIATAEVSAGHAYIRDSVVEISGAPAAINGQHRVLSVLSSTRFTFALAVPNGSFSGLFACKLAPCGWQQAFIEGNTAVYRSLDPQSTRMFLQVVDGTDHARVTGYESMLSATLGQGLFPDSTQVNGGLFWLKAWPVNANPRGWILVGDSKTFWLWINTNTRFYGDGFVTGFGDIASFKPGDAYGCALFGSFAAEAGNSNTLFTSSVSHAHLTGATATFYVARAYNLFGGSRACGKRAESYATQDGFSGFNTSVSYPNPVNNAILLSPMLVVEPGSVLRGRLRGPLFVPQSLAATNFTPLVAIDGQGQYQGRRLLPLRGVGRLNSTTETVATLFMDVTGPWE